MADPALALLAEALARLEHKLDLVMTHAGVKSAMPMHFMGHVCPVCNEMIDYQVDLNHNVVKRVCGCKTGKQPPLIPLLPVPGVTNGPAASATAAGRSDAPSAPDDSGGRQGRRPGSGSVPR